MRLRDFNCDEKSSIVISLLKDHCIKREWLDRNKQRAALFTSGLLATAELESLFTACKTNTGFIADLEAYITTKLSS